MQVETKIDKCPCCQKQINITCKISEYIAERKTDLSCIFLIDNALPKELDNSKILHSVEEFDNDMIYKQIEMYLQNR